MILLLYIILLFHCLAFTAPVGPETTTPCVNCANNTSAMTSNIAELAKKQYRDNISTNNITNYATTNLPINSQNATEWILSTTTNAIAYSGASTPISTSTTTPLALPITASTLPRVKSRISFVSPKNHSIGESPRFLSILSQVTHNEAHEMEDDTDSNAVIFPRFKLEDGKTLQAKSQQYDDNVTATTVANGKDELNNIFNAITENNDAPIFERSISSDMPSLDNSNAYRLANFFSPLLQRKPKRFYVFTTSTTPSPIYTLIDEDSPTRKDFNVIRAQTSIFNSEPRLIQRRENRQYGFQPSPLNDYVSGSQHTINGCSCQNTFCTSDCQNNADLFDYSYGAVSSTPPAFKNRFKGQLVPELPPYSCQDYPYPQIEAIPTSREDRRSEKKRETVILNALLEKEINNFVDMLFVQSLSKLSNAKPYQYNAGMSHDIVDGYDVGGDTSLINETPPSSHKFFALEHPLNDERLPNAPGTIYYHMPDLRYINSNDI